MGTSGQLLRAKTDDEIPHFFMVLTAPKTRVSTSSLIMASMTPCRFNHASSASASPRAYKVEVRHGGVKLKQTHHSPLHPKKV